QPIIAADSGYTLPVDVHIRDTAGTPVFSARIQMWLSPQDRSRNARTTGHLTDR
ncbi:MAG TPA: DUF4442 domain-containing protein, partial [Stenotrophomonas sp.]|nr:DUF4442 domain-containing protein [Stenotrophomonas sp.]